jgi:DNA processing protein
MFVSSTKLLHPDAPDYPPALRALGAPDRAPPTLHLRGALPPLPGIAVVGKREATDEARAFTRALVLDLAALRYAIWSGGALGIDASAHEAALEAGAPTVVVAGGGLDQPYPPEHAPLFARVLASGGALVSHLPDDTPPMRPGFLARNRVLAAITLATVVIEAGLQSGARSTAAAARRLGRPLCVVPHPPWSATGKGCAEELLLGAQPITSAADVVAALDKHAVTSLPTPRRPPRPRKKPTDPGVQLHLDPLEQAILRVLGNQPTHLDVICETVGAALPAVVGALLTLSLEAVVVEGPAGSYRRGTR